MLYFSSAKWQQSSSQDIVDDALLLWKVLLDRHERHWHDSCSGGGFGHAVIPGQNPGVQSG